MSISKYHLKNIVIISVSFLILASLLIFKLHFYHGFTPDWDEAGHLTAAYYYFKSISTGNPKEFIDLLINSKTLYPPVYQIAVGFAYLLVREWSFAAVATNLSFMLIFMLLVYSIASTLGSRKAGLVAAVLTPLLPLYLTIQERAIIDYASGTLFLFSFFILFKTENFTNRKYSILFGLTILLNLLTKWPFVIPGIPFIVYALQSIRVQNKFRKSVIGNIVIALGISSLGLVWYYFHYGFMIKNLEFFWNPKGFAQEIWKYPHGFTPTNFLFYSVITPSQNSGVGIIVLAFFYFSLLLPRSNKKEIYLLGSVLITYIVLTSLNDKGSYYMVYSWPLMMIVTTISLLKIRPEPARSFFIFTFTSAILINFLFTQVNYISKIKLELNIGNHYLDILPNYNSKFPSSSWPTKKIVINIYERGLCDKNILVFPDNQFFNRPNIKFYLTTLEATTNVVPAYTSYNPIKDTSFDIDYLKSFQCVVTKNGYSGMFANAIAINDVNDYLSKQSNYNRITFDAPDKSSIFVFIKSSEY